MSSLIHAIEARVHELGGTDTEVRVQGVGSMRLVVAFMLKGKPRAAVFDIPRNKLGRHGMVAAIQKAIQ